MHALVLVALLGIVPAAAGESSSAPSKKEKLLRDKALRTDVHAARVPSREARAALSLRNTWTHEVLAVDAPDAAAKSQARSAPSPTRGAPPASVPVPAAPPAPHVDRFLRDHFTNQSTAMDPRLVDVVLRAAAHFQAGVVEVVSGYRSPKYNLMLRKKGHQVARDSQHPMGHAVDFRLPGAATTRQLYTFVRSLRLGGVGYYPDSHFVHADVGPIRTWKGN